MSQRQLACATKSVPFFRRRRRQLKMLATPGGYEPSRSRDVVLRALALKGSGLLPCASTLSPRMQDGLRHCHAPLLYPPYRIVIQQVGKLLLTYRVVHTDGDMLDHISRRRPENPCAICHLQIVKEANGLLRLSGPLRPVVRRSTRFHHAVRHAYFVG